MLTGRHRLAGVARLLFASALPLLVAAPAYAEQRLVRVLWDVGRETVYARVDERTKPGADGFAVPVNDAEARKAGFDTYESYGLLRKGDRVRLYLVNFNPVAHVWHESSVAEMIAPEPSLAGAILNSTMAGVTGGLKLPSTWLAALANVAPGLTFADPCEPLHKPLQELTAEAKALDAAVVKATTLAESLKLNADAQKAAGIPTQRVFWNTFDNQEALRLIQVNTEVFGIDFAGKYADFRVVLKEVETAVTSVNSQLMAFDRALTDLNASNPAGDCSDVVGHRDTVQTFASGLTAEDSPFGRVSAKYAATKKLLDSYALTLQTSTWSDNAHEVVVKESVIEEGALRLDAVFVSTDKNYSGRIQRSLVLEVQTHFPALTISSGVGMHGFAFKTLALAQDTSTATDGTVSAKGRLVVVDDPKWDKFVPVWIQNVRLFARGRAGLYASFGTTPDRNIFKNGIVGLSLVVPRWRTSFTGGLIAARGYEEEDLQPLVAKFSDSAGFAIKDTALATLPLEGPKWKRAGYFSITFMLVSF